MKRNVYALLLLILGSFQASAQPSFFEGKTVTFVVGYLPGDGYDIWGRLLVAHLPKHLPGHPYMIVQNMPGAGSRVAANYIYGVAKPDGLTLGSIGPSLYLDQLIGKKEVKFDWAKFGWIGSTESTPWLFYMKAETPYKSLEDVRKAHEPPKCSATATGTSGYFVTKILEEALGAKFHIVMGYRGGSEQDLAFERGEVVCRALSIPTFFAREPFHTWRKKNLIRVLVQTKRKHDLRLPNTPTIYELMDEYKTPESVRRAVAAVLASGDIGRPIIAPPGLPGERLNVLRDAFRKTIADEAFLADVKAKKLEVDPEFGEPLEIAAKEVMNQPRDVIEQMKKLLGE